MAVFLSIVSTLCRFAVLSLVCYFGVWFVFGLVGLAAGFGAHPERAFQIEVQGVRSSVFLGMLLLLFAILGSLLLTYPFFAVLEPLFDTGGDYLGQLRLLLLRDVQRFATLMMGLFAVAYFLYFLQEARDAIAWAMMEDRPYWGRPPEFFPSGQWKGEALKILFFGGAFGLSLRRGKRGGGGEEKASPGGRSEGFVDGLDENGRTRLTAILAADGVRRARPRFPETLDGRSAPRIDLDALQAALASGEDPNRPDLAGDRPLALAARLGSLGAAQALIAKGADPLGRNALGKSPLMGALEAQAWELALHLVENGGLDEGVDNLGLNCWDHFAEADGQDRAPRALRKRLEAFAGRSPAASENPNLISPVVAAALVCGRYHAIYKFRSSVAQRLLRPLVVLVSILPRHLRKALLFRLSLAEYGVIAASILLALFAPFGVYVVSVALALYAFYRRYDFLRRESGAALGQQFLYAPFENAGHEPRAPRFEAPLAAMISDCLRYGNRARNREVDLREESFLPLMDRIKGPEESLFFLRVFELASIAVVILAGTLVSYLPEDGWAASGLAFLWLVFLAVWVEFSFRLHKRRLRVIEQWRGVLVDYIVGTRRAAAERWRAASAAPRRESAGRDAAGRDEPFLVYLRPFTLDAVDPMTEQTFEALLVEALREFGAVLSLGSDPQGAGASRLVTQDAGWRDEARRLLGGASGVLMVPDHSPGVLWEIEQLRALGALERTVFLAPPRWAMTERFDEARWRETRRVWAEIGLRLPPLVPQGAIFGLSDEGRIANYAPFGLEPVPWGVLLDAEARRRFEVKADQAEAFDGLYADATLWLEEFGLDPRAMQLETPLGAAIAEFGDGAPDA